MTNRAHLPRPRTHHHHRPAHGINPGTTYSPARPPPRASTTTPAGEAIPPQVNPATTSGRHPQGQGAPAASIPTTRHHGRTTAPEVHPNALCIIELSLLPLTSYYLRATG